MSRGFSLLEVLIVMAIVILLSTGLIYRMSDARRDKAVQATGDAILFTLEEAKNNAIAGKYGLAHGVHFASSAYTSFSGTVYSAGGANNVVHTVSSDIEITPALSGGAVDVIFARLNGEANVTGTITVAAADDSTTTRVLSIGAGGDVSIE